MFQKTYIILSFTLYVFRCFAQADSANQPPPLAPFSLQQVRGTVTVNPNISVVGDFRSWYFSEGKRNFGAGLNEAEVAFQSVVDPYARADFFLSMEKDAAGDFNADIEEAYLTATSLPGGLQLKAGKFFSPLGRINPVHSHALPFISFPVAYLNYFGEGISDEGISLSWLIPNHTFYQELIVLGTMGPADCPSFTASSKNKYLATGHFKNFWDVSANTTLELGFTGLTGPNDSGLTTNIGAVDLTYKWKPLQFNTYKSFTWQSEAYFSNAELKNDSAIRSSGWYSLINFQLSKRWFATAMYSFSNKPKSSKIWEQGYSVTIGWYATEYQKLEIEGLTVESNVNKQTYQVLFRWIFAIGSHGAHQY